MRSPADTVGTNEFSHPVSGLGNTGPYFVCIPAVPGQVGGEQVAIGHGLNLKVPRPARHVPAMQENNRLTLPGAVLHRVIFAVSHLGSHGHFSLLGGLNLVILSRVC